MISIHPVHRKLAEIAYMCSDTDGNLVMGMAELKLMMPLLRQNLQLIRQIDELKQLAYAAYLGGDMAWVQDICSRLDDLEVTMV